MYLSNIIILFDFIYIESFAVLEWFWFEFLTFERDLRLHKLVFEQDVLPDGTEVAYYSRGQVVAMKISEPFFFLII